MLGKLDDMMRFQETALNIREQRQQLLASNIANADTPNFKARDIDFTKALQGALARSGGSTTSSGGTSSVAMPEIAKTTEAHLSSTGGKGSIEGAPLLYANPRQASIDGNTVDMDDQRNQFTDNAMRYEASLTFISSKIKGMLTAINGQ